MTLDRQRRDAGIADQLAADELIRNIKDASEETLALIQLSPDGIVRVQRQFLSVICTVEIRLAPESPILENKLGLE